VLTRSSCPVLEVLGELSDAALLVLRLTGSGLVRGGFGAPQVMLGLVLAVANHLLRHRLVVGVGQKQVGRR